MMPRLAATEHDRDIEKLMTRDLPNVEANAFGVHHHLSALTPVPDHYGNNPECPVKEHYVTIT